MKPVSKHFVPILATLLVMLFMWLSSVPLLSWYQFSAQHQELDDASFRWYHEKINNYSFEFDTSNPENYPFRMPVQIHVRNGAFVAAYEVDSGRKIDISGVADLPANFDMAFAFVAALLERQPRTIDVEYDALAHFPARIAVNFGENEQEASIYRLRAFRETDNNTR